MAVAATSDVAKFCRVERRDAAYHLIVIPHVVRCRRGRSSHDGHWGTVVAEIDNHDAESVEPLDASLCPARNFLEFLDRALRRIRLGVLSHEFCVPREARLVSVDAHECRREIYQGE